MGVSGCDCTAAGAEGGLSKGDFSWSAGFRITMSMRQASLEAGRAQLSAVSQWMDALRNPNL